MPPRELTTCLSEVFGGAATEHTLHGISRENPEDMNMENFSFPTFHCNPESTSSWYKIYMRDSLNI